jgi:predicted nucleic acid-binding protein
LTSAAEAIAAAASVPARGLEIDLAIAACAVEHNASLWTLNPADFKDVPALILHDGSDRRG